MKPCNTPGCDRAAVAQSLCQQPLDSGHSVIGELDDGGLRIAGRGGAAVGQDNNRNLGG